MINRCFSHPTTTMSNPFLMTVPKKHTSISKKHIRKNLKKKGILGSAKSFFNSKISLFTEITFWWRRTDC